MDCSSDRPSGQADRRTNGRGGRQRDGCGNANRSRPRTCGHPSLPPPPPQSLRAPPVGPSPCHASAYDDLATSTLRTSRPRTSHLHALHLGSGGSGPRGAPHRPPPRRPRQRQRKGVRAGTPRRCCRWGRVRRQGPAHRLQIHRVRPYIARHEGWRRKPAVRGQQPRRRLRRRHARRRHARRRVRARHQRPPQRTDPWDRPREALPLSPAAAPLHCDRRRRPRRRAAAQVVSLRKSEVGPGRCPAAGAPPHAVGS
jgi:hypothetical protein